MPSIMPRIILGILPSGKEDVLTGQAGLTFDLYARP
jgi:hypothetical protein